MTDQSQQDYILRAEDVQFVPFTLPGWSGETTAAFLNPDVERAPFVAMAKLAPGAYLQRHMHPKAVEALYVEGQLINNGERLTTGSFMAHGPGVEHGPHTTETGCTLMFLQSPGVTVEDTVLID